MKPVHIHTCVASKTPALPTQVTLTPPIHHPRHLSAHTIPWTIEEHRLFLRGLEVHGKGQWAKIATLVKSRTWHQVRGHAQAYFRDSAKAAAASALVDSLKKQRVLPCGSKLTHEVAEAMQKNEIASQFVTEKMENGGGMGHQGSKVQKVNLVATKAEGETLLSTSPTRDLANTEGAAMDDDKSTGELATRGANPEGRPRPLSSPEHYTTAKDVIGDESYSDEEIGNMVWRSSQFAGEMIWKTSQFAKALGAVE